MKFSLIPVFFAFLALGCAMNQSGASNLQVTAAPTIDVSNRKSNDRANDANASDAHSDNEIESCLPEKVYRGETFTVKFSTPHGGYFAIQREDPEVWYLLNSESAGAFPKIDFDLFTKTAEIEIDTSKTQQVDYSKENKSDKYVAEMVFNKSGWYKIMVSDQDFGQEDPLTTGICRVYFKDQSRPK